MIVNCKETTLHFTVTLFFVYGHNPQTGSVIPASVILLTLCTYAKESKAISRQGAPKQEGIGREMIATTVKVHVTGLELVNIGFKHIVLFFTPLLLYTV